MQATAATAVTVSDIAVAGPSKCATPSSIESILNKDSKSALFKSPNTVCPMDGKLPTPVPSNVVEAREYPFESMTQARAIHRRENILGITGPANITGPFATPHPPPPYPAENASENKSSIQTNPGNIAISSPLLVNLLQNEAVNDTQGKPTAILKRGQELVLLTKATRTPTSRTNVTNVVLNDDDLLQSKSAGVNKIHQLQQSQSIISDVVDANNSDCTSTTMQNTVGARNNIISDTVVQPQQQQPSLVVATNIGTMTVPSSNVNLKIQQSRFLSQQQLLLGNQHQQVRPIIPFVQPSTIQNTISLQLQNQQRHQLNKQLIPQAETSSHTTLRNNTRFPVYQPHSVSTIQSSSFRNVGSLSALKQSFSNDANSSLMAGQQQIISNTTNAQLISNEIIATNQLTQLNIDDSSQSTYNPRWPLKPMDSATKSSFQEFTRYQMQYNLIQQQQQQSSATVKNISNSENLGLQHLVDLDELTKNDLDSLLPSLNEGDLDTALGIDTIRNPIDTLLDAKDLALDLINQPPLSTASKSVITGSQSTITPSSASVDTACTAINSIKVTTKPPTILTSAGKEPQFLINPLTGELEPIPSEDSTDDDESAAINALNMSSFPEFSSEISNSIYSDDDNSCSTAFSKTTSDHSDNERSSNSENSSRSRSSGKVKTKERKESNRRNKIPKDKTLIKSTMLKEKLHQGLRDKLLFGKTKGKEKCRVKNIGSPIISAASIGESSGIDPVFPEKIKLKLKLEKSEPVKPAYKVDVSFVPLPKKAQTSALTSASISSASSSSSTLLLLSTGKQQKLIQQQNASSVSSVAVAGGSGLLPNINPAPAGEELRVPPLHISLRGRNSVVIKNSKKDRKKSHSGGEEDEFGKKSSIKKGSTVIDGCTVLTTVQKVLHIPNHHRSQSMDDIDAATTATSINFVKTKNQVPPNCITQKSKQSKVTSSADIMKTDISTSLFGYNMLSTKPLLHHENGSGSGGSKFNDDQSETSLHTVKRSSSDFILNPNGIISPEKKRRLSLSTLASSTSVSSIVTTSAPMVSSSPITVVSTAPIKINESATATTFKPISDLKVREFYTQLDGPIGSTNVGTLPQHSSLSSTKNQKSNNNNNNSAYNKIQKSVSKLKSKSPNSLIKEPSLLEDKIVAKNITNNSDGSELDAQLIKQQPFQDGEKVNRSLSLLSDLIAPSDTKQSSTNTVSMNELKTVDNSKSISAPTVVSNSIATTSMIISSESKTKSKVNDNQHTSQYNNRPPECTTSLAGSPKQCSEASNRMPAGVRSSPGSQVQGEDSGIESMDALSEKSPHQTSSPQGDVKRSDSPPKESSKVQKPTVINVDDFTNIVDIEAALAKMEGINEHINSCDTTKNTSGAHKFNGDHVTIVRSSSRSQDFELSETLEHSMDKIGSCTIKNSSARIHQSIVEIDKKSTLICENSKDLNENKRCLIKTTTDENSIDRQSTTLTVVELNTEQSSAITCRNDKISTTQELINQLKDYDDELNAEDNTTQTEIRLDGKCEHFVENSYEISTNDPSHMKNEEKEDILTQLSIEIPPGENVPRVRTRASSKLESPLDIQKQSPSDCSTTAQTSVQPMANYVKSVKLSSATVDRISPKIAGKGLKRKRQESESSTQSTLSDDTFARGKKSRKTTIENVTITITTSTTSAPATVVTSSTVVTSAHQVPTTSSTSLKQAQGSSGIINSSNNKKTTENCKNQLMKPFSVSIANNESKKEAEESSDSDEPLIEIAGKVRNSKLAKYDNDKVLRNHIKLSNSATKSSSSSVNSCNIATAKSLGNSQKISGSIDDKATTMSTRRSVRMNLNITQTKLANKTAAIVSVSTTPDDIKKTSMVQNATKHNSTNLNPLEQSGEARRKTRSASE